MGRFPAATRAEASSGALRDGRDLGYIPAYHPENGGLLRHDIGPASLARLLALLSRPFPPAAPAEEVAAYGNANEENPGTVRAALAAAAGARGRFAVLVARPAVAPWPAPGRLAGRE